MTQWMPWTDEREATAVKLWKDGLTARVIADQLGGVSRSAVIGKLHRLGQSGRTQPQRRYRTVQPPRVRRPKTKPHGAKVWSEAALAARGAASAEAVERLAVQAGPDIEIPIEQRKLLADLDRGDCHWPYGDGPFYFCCHQAVPGQRYCEFHVKRAYAPMSERMRRYGPGPLWVRYYKAGPHDSTASLREFETLEAHNK